MKKQAATTPEAYDALYAALSWYEACPECMSTEELHEKAVEKLFELAQEAGVWIANTCTDEGTMCEAGEEDSEVLLTRE